MAGPAAPCMLSFCLWQCHVSSVPVFNSMKRPEVKPWGAVVTAAMVIALFVYTGTGRSEAFVLCPAHGAQLLLLLQHVLLKDSGWESSELPFSRTAVQGTPGLEQL